MVHIHFGSVACQRERSSGNGIKGMSVIIFDDLLFKSSREI